jgi:MFS family permease
LGYSAFLRPNARFLAFGFLLALLSSSGQTFLIGLFGDPLRATFELSNGEFGLVYSVATVISGVSLLWLGRIVDRLDLRLVTTGVLLGASAGALMLAAAVHVVMLAAAFLLLRLCGQGLLMHTAQTTMGRYFSVDRGKAVSVATLGLPSAEAVLPTAVVALMAVIGWRGSWLTIAAVLSGFALPLALYLLRGHSTRRQDLAVAEQQGEGGDATAGAVSWRRADVLCDPRFYGLLPAVMAPPFIMTALFFHQDPLADAKGWPLSWVATSFTAFAASHIVALIVAGPLVDRLGVKRLIAGFLAPMTLALLVIVIMDSPWGAPLYLGLAGLSMGAAGTLMGALWPALYGTAHLGAIRSLMHSAMVFVTAGAPYGVGGLMDAGVSLIAIVTALAFWNVFAAALALVALRGAPVH